MDKTEQVKKVISDVQYHTLIAVIKYVKELQTTAASNEVPGHRMVMRELLMLQVEQLKKRQQQEVKKPIDDVVASFNRSREGNES